MKIFISWSGEESHAVAQILRVQLPCIINAIKPFVSSEDVEKGAAWFQHVGTELQKADFGILCLTNANQANRWVQFEAGALAGRFSKARVAPILIDTTPSSIKPPLSQFQLTELGNREDFFKLLVSINQYLGEEALPQETLKESFNNWWDSFDQKVKAALKKVPKNEGKTIDRSEREILDEILSLTRSISSNQATMRKEFSDEIKDRTIDLRYEAIPRPVVRYKRVHNGEGGLIIRGVSGINNSESPAEGLHETNGSDV